MSNTLVVTILLLICAGQIGAILRGRLPAAIYYLCVAPLGYFSVWQFGTWGPDRLCGILIIAGGLLRFRRDKSTPRLSSHALGFFLLFLTLVTITGSLFWPTDAMAGRSSVYGSLRGPVQILNWFIVAGAAWNVAIALTQPRAFERARRVLIVVGVLHSGYAIYQMAAYASGLPATGIRRPYSEVDLDSGGEQHAAFFYNGVNIGRPGSLIGEPKGLGAISLVWMAAMLTVLMEGGMNSKLAGAFVLSLITLFITFSTSAWGGFVSMMAIALWATRRRMAYRVWRFLVPLLLVFISGWAIVERSGLVPEVKGGISSLIRERTIDRSDYLADLAEVEAKEVIAEHPLIAICGTGLGGMSFYIAERMGGSDIILFPNTGLLAYLCDMGVLGVVLLLYALRRGLYLSFLPSGETDASALAMSFIGTVCLMQSFIFDAGIRMFALAFLLAAELRQTCLIK